MLWDLGLGLGFRVKRLGVLGLGFRDLGVWGLGLRVQVPEWVKGSPMLSTISGRQTVTRRLCGEELFQSYRPMLPLLRSFALCVLSPGTFGEFVWLIYVQVRGRTANVKDAPLIEALCTEDMHPTRGCEIFSEISCAMLSSCSPQPVPRSVLLI